MRDLTGGFTDDQVRRYSRHVLLPDVGGAGQIRLLAAAVEVEVHGAAARVAALYLVAAGVGTVRLRGDLERPLARGEVQFPLVAADLGRPLGEALLAALAGHNRDVTVSGCRTGDTVTVSGCRTGDTMSTTSSLPPDAVDTMSTTSSLPPDAVDTMSTTSSLPPDAVLVIVGDAPNLPLPLAMMRGGEAAARLVYRLAAGRP